VTDGNRPAHPERDDDWNARARNETATERLDRNWGDLIQELRVLQTGVQFLTGFLLTLPFQQKFGQLSGAQVALYLCTVSASIGATAFLQAPVSVHRALFRRHRRRATVLLAHRLSIVGMILLACAVVGVASLIFDVLKEPGPGSQRPLVTHYLACRALGCRPAVGPTIRTLRGRTRRVSPGRARTVTFLATDIWLCLNARRFKPRTVRVPVVPGSSCMWLDLAERMCLPTRWRTLTDVSLVQQRHRRFTAARPSSPG
jgi:hypothetical protein